MNTRTKLVQVQAAVVVLSLLTWLFLGFATPVRAATSVFINEIHYDNAGTDTDEAIEVAGPAGTDLTGWSIVLYNGNGGASYGAITLSGIIPDQQDGFGTLYFDHSGIQNGAPDGLALVDSSSAVVQFLSYEGSFTAAGGPADGMTSTDIGVAESSSTAAGESLQLTGEGTIYEDFVWASPTANTFGAVNTGQTFGGGPEYTPIYDIQYTTDTSGDSPYKDQTDVTTEGIVTAIFSNGYFIEDPAGGAWNGLWVHDTDNTPALGDRVRVTGTVVEYYNLTELDTLTGYHVASSGNPLPDPIVVTTAAANDEQYESVLVRMEDVVVTAEEDAYSEWEVDDGSAPLAVDNLGTDTYVPVLGDELAAIIGPLNYSYGAFKIAPRDDGDIIPPAVAPEIIITEVMQNPAAVGDSDGEWFEIYNAESTSVDLDGWTFRDDGTNLFTVSGPLVIQPDEYLVLGINGNTSANGGVEVDYDYPGSFLLGNSDDEIIIEMADSAEVDRVEYDGGAAWPDPNGASMMLKDVALDNNDGANWQETPGSLTYGDGDAGTPGCPNVGCYTPIHDIQYTTDPSGDSPYKDQAGVTTEGIVTARFQYGYFIEDPVGGAWNGLWVHDTDNTPALGDRVRLTGTVIEYYNLTELDALAYYEVESSANPLPAPVVLSTADVSQEQYESVLVRVENVTVTDDDLDHGEWSVSDGSGDVIIDDKGSYTYTPTNGDALVAVIGPLDYAYGAFKIQPRDDNDIILPAPPSTLVINEFLADPAGDLTGDANGDGVRDSSDDEFVEIVNNSDSDVDISGWTLSDAVGVRHTFPADTVVSANCAIVVFGGGAPTGSFGGVVVQTASSGALGLNNGGDTVTLNDGTIDQAVYTYGSEGGDNQSLTRDPDVTGVFVKHSTAAGSGGALFSPGTMIDGSSFAGCGPVFGACGDPATFIHEVQGSGDVSPLNGASGVIVEGVVVGDFQDTDELKGFFLQEEDSDVDADATTSEGVFVYDNSFGVDVNVGDVVRVMGNVTEYYELTELNSVSDMVVCGSGAASAATVELPVDSLDVWEQHEGMLINIPQTLYATGNYNQGRYGEVDLSVGDRLDTPTNVVLPGADAIALQDLNDRSRIQLEDGSTIENPPVAPYIGDDNTLRAGDTIPELTGVLHYSFGAYELHPTGAVNFTRVNTRDATPPDVGGALKVASFNVLNYFVTLDDDSCPYSGGCRGADTAEEFTRQRDKIIAAIVTMDADVIGLMEMENHPTDAALANLVEGLNDVAGAGTYDYIPTGPIGADVIKVAFIYRAGAVTPVGSYAILDSSVDPTFIDTKNRPALAQTFEEDTTGETFTAVVNHLKSKGSACDDIGDPDMGDGQGNCNLTRTNAATALVNWLAGDPTHSGDTDFLIIGDLNSYAMEDPIAAIKGAGYTNLIESFVGSEGYSYVYYGQAGYLDHALSSPHLTSRVTGVTEWHINADEPAALDYNDYNQSDLYNADPYRASDHDPVLVSFTFTPPVAAFTPSAVNIFVDESVTFTNESTGDEPLSYLWDFGNGQTSTDESPVYSWSEPGLYTITLTTSHDLGSDSASVEILVRPRIVPFETFDIHYSVIRWYGNRGYFAVSGQFELAEGYTRDDLARDLELALTIAGGAPVLPIV